TNTFNLNQAASGGKLPALANVPSHLMQHATTEKQKADNEFLTAAQAGDDMKTFIQEARSGNKIAYAYSPTEGVLTLNTGRGVKRVNMAEIESYSGAGSAVDKIKAFFGKAESGASIPPDVLKDMESLHAAVTGNARKAYERKIKSI